MNKDAENPREPAMSQRARALVEQLLLSDTVHDPTAVAAMITAHPDLQTQLEMELQKLRRIEGAMGEASFPNTTFSAASPSVSGVRFSIPGYEIQRRVGAGGQASVFRATQVSTGQAVAIKAIYGGALCSDAAKKRFDREVRILVELDHPHIANVIDRGSTDEGTPFVIIRFVEGQNLDEWLNERRVQWRGTPSRAEVNELLKMFVTICETINAAHQKGIVHRDVKPSNIRIDQRGQPHVLDFGLALEVIMDAGAGGEHGPAAAMTKTGQFVGSLPWASPEQIGVVDEPVGERSDVYSLGLILYDMLAGRLPFESNVSLKELLRCIAPAVKIAPSVRRRRTSPAAAHKPFGPALDAIVLKAISLNPRDRYGSAGELAEDLQAYLQGHATVAGRRRSATRRTVAAMTIVGLSVIGLSTWLIARLAWSSEPPVIHGMVWCDDNADGFVQPEEKGLVGATVYADLNANGKFDSGNSESPAEPAVVSDHRGEYRLLPGNKPSEIRCQVPRQYVLTFPRTPREPRDIFTMAGIGTLRRLQQSPGELPNHEHGQDLVLDIPRQIPAIATFASELSPLNVELDLLDDGELIVGWVQENRNSPFTYLARVRITADQISAVYLGSLPIERSVADAGDIDGDGRIDLLIRSREGVPNAEANWYLQICWGKNDGTFDLTTPLQPVATNQRGMNAWLEDINGDKSLDVLYHLTKWGGYFTFQLDAALYDGEGGFRFERSRTLLRGPEGHGLISFSPMDLDGDGDRDLLLIADDDSQDEGQSYVAVNGGIGAYSLLKFIDFVPSSETPGQDRSMVNQAVFCDVDQDGNRELLILEDLTRGHRVRLYRHLDRAFVANAAVENWPWEAVNLAGLWRATAWPRQLANSSAAARRNPRADHVRRGQRFDFGWNSIPPGR